MWVLRSSEDGAHPVKFRIPSGAVKTVGRAPRADIILDVGLVSRLHCRLEAGPDRIDVIDLSSTNGTFVNDARVQRGHLSPGDRLRVGRVELQVEWRAAADDDVTGSEGTDSCGVPGQSS